MTSTPRGGRGPGGGSTVSRPAPSSPAEAAGAWLDAIRAGDAAGAWGLMTREMREEFAWAFVRSDVEELTRAQARRIVRGLCVQGRRHEVWPAFERCFTDAFGHEGVRFVEASADPERVVVATDGRSAAVGLLVRGERSSPLAVARLPNGEWRVNGTEAGIDVAEEG